MYVCVCVIVAGVMYIYVCVIVGMLCTYVCVCHWGNVAYIYYTYMLLCEGGGDSSVVRAPDS